MSESAARSMKAIRPRRMVHSAEWARRTALFSAVLFIVSGLGHRTGFVETPPFLQLLVLVAALALFSLALASVAFVRIWRRGDMGLPAALAATFIALVVLTPFGVTATRMVIHPRLSDISTDLDNAPRFTLALKERELGMNAVTPISPSAARLQADAYPDVAGRRYEYPRDRILQAVDALIAERGWRVLGRIESSDTGHAVTIEAVARTPLLGFSCDVAIRVFDDSSATFVDMRSASRYGRHDHGDKATRNNRFLSDLDDRVAALAGM
jgi:hypothetical protein